VNSKRYVTVITHHAALNSSPLYPVHFGFSLHYLGGSVVHLVRRCNDGRSLQRRRIYCITWSVV